MAEAVVSMVTERIGNLLIEEAKIIHGVRDQVRDIRDELWWMQCFLRDADARQCEDHRVRTWIREIKEIAYDAGDALESFLLRVEYRKGGSILNVLKRYTCILNECIVRHSVGSKIQDIKIRISYLTSRLHTYGIISSLSKDPEGSNRRQSQSNSSYLHGHEDDFVWLEADVKKMVRLLVNGDKDGDSRYKVVAICSSGGMGKSILARKVCEHDEVKRHFEAVAWVSITQNWQLREVFQQILSKLIPGEKKQIFKLTNDDDLRKKLSEVQQEKKCLIVLDDIWKEETWNDLKGAFPDDKNMKGKLLLTTRNKDVASHVNPSAFVHELKPLCTDEGWKLLKKIAFPAGDGSGSKEVREKEKLGRQMIKHCGGLPLAVIVLGRILATKQNLAEWKRVHQNIDSYLSTGEGIGKDGSEITKILGPSYNDLPYQLKPCFLYLGKFQENEEIEAKRLYQLWMAESMILSEDRREEETMMDVAERYLGVLAQRCMVHVQLEENKYGLNIGKFKSCRLHDFMRNICLSKAKEEDFFNTFNFQHENGSKLLESSSSFANKTRRVVIYFKDEKIDSGNFSLSKETSQCLRSLLFFAAADGKYCGMPSMVRSRLSDFKMLRVLAIEGFRPACPVLSIIELANFNWDNLALLKAVGKLIHLRFLSLRDSKFFMFPSSINNLQNLQTLDLRGTFRFYPKCSASVLRKMRRLQHLYLPSYRDSDRRKMRRLQHLYLPCYPYCDSDIDGDNMVQVFKPSKLQLDSLSNLETLENYIPKWCDGKGLCKLVNLQKLEAMLYDLEEVEQSIDYLSNTAAKHMRHSYVRIIGDLDFDSTKGHGILIKILSCDHLHRLDINGGICKKLPGCDEVLNFSQSLTILSLDEFPLKEDPMPTLEKLPNLQSLTLYNAFRGKTMVCADKGFPRLKSLELSILESFDNWRVEEGAMPELSRLEFQYCKSLKMVPDGLRFITTLTELVIRKMDEEFCRRVKYKDGQEGEDFDIIRHVTSIQIFSGDL